MEDSVRISMLADKAASIVRDLSDFCSVLGGMPQHAQEDATRQLDDQQLVTFAAFIRAADAPEAGAPWEDQPAEQGSAILRECRHRAQQGRTFSAYLYQPTIGDLLRRLLDT